MEEDEYDRFYSVTELPPDLFEEPRDVMELIEVLVERDAGRPSVENLLWPLADGLYWHCANSHGGMGSSLYGILCRLTDGPVRYRPSPFAAGPDDEDSMHVYRSLSAMI